MRRRSADSSPAFVSRRVVIDEAERLGEIGIDLAGRRLRHIAGLRALLEAVRRRCAGAVRFGKIVAAVARIIGGRLQARFHVLLAGLGTDPGLAAVDRGVEQVGERRRDRRQLRTRRLGAGRPRGVLGLLGLFRPNRLVGRGCHGANMGQRRMAGKGRAGGRGLRAAQNPFTTSCTCSTSGGEAKQWPTSLRHSWKSGEPRKSTVWFSTVAHPTNSR